MALGKPATHLNFDQQASYLQVWATVGLWLESRLLAPFAEVAEVPLWLDLMGKIIPS